MQMDVQIAARYRGCLHGRLPVDCTYFKSDLLVAIGGYSQAGNVHVFEPLEGLKVFHSLGHSAQVDAVAFSQPSQQLCTLLLCSCSAEVALLWDVQGCREANDKGIPCRARTLATHLGYVQCAKFSPNSHYVALGHGNEVLVYQVKTCSLDTTLSGHNGDITGVMFYPKCPQQVVTIAEDRTFKIWNLRDSVLLYQSAIISASPFTCLAIHSDTEALVLGSSDGKLRVFMLEGQHCHCVQESDVGRSLAKKQSRAGQHHLDKDDSHDLTVISSHPKWKGSILASPESVDAAVEMGSSQLLGVFFWDHNPQSSEAAAFDVPPLLDMHSKHPARDVLINSSHLVVVTHHSLLLLNSKTLELMDWKDLRDPLPMASSVEEVSLQPVPVMCSAHFCAAPVAMGDNLYCTSSALMEATVSVLGLSCTEERPSRPVCSASHVDGDELKDASTPPTTQLSVLSSAPLLSSSPLAAKMAAPSGATKLKSHSSSSVSRGRCHKPIGAVDRPVTFHSKVKSSGYTSVPQGKLFTPQTGLSQRKATSAGNGRVKSKGSLSSVLQYPADAQPATELELSLSLTDRPSTINSLQYSCEGRHLACACSDGSVHLLNASLNADKGKAFVGHRGNVYSTCWSHGNPWLISCSSDKTACVWCLSQKDPLLTISHSQTNTKIQQKVGAQSGKTKLGSKDNPPFSHEVTHAQFYYLDKFLLLACGNSFYLYSYHIDTEHDDVKRYQSSTKCKVVQQFPMQSAQHITALSAINDFYSYLVLAAGSNKSIEVFDMNAGKSAATIPDVHERPVHSIVQNKGSKFIGHPPGAYDLFLTSAVSCGVKLWDLRTARCVQHYTSHPNRAVPLGAAFSPCAKFIATGAENRSVYVYDIRSTAPLHKLTCHSNTVTTVTYHPLHNQMVTGTANGKLWLFANKTAN